MWCWAVWLGASRSATCLLLCSQKRPDLAGPTPLLPAGSRRRMRGGCRGAGRSGRHGCSAGPGPPGLLAPPGARDIPRGALILVGNGQRCRLEPGERREANCAPLFGLGLVVFFSFPFPPLSLPFPPHYSNQRQPDKNAPSVDNGPAFLLASLLCSFAERKKVSSPPPFSPPPPRGRLLRKSRHGATGPRSAPPGPGRAPRGGRGTHTQVAPQPGAPLPQPPCQRDGPFLPCRRGAGGGCPLCIGLQGIRVRGRWCRKGGSWQDAHEPAPTRCPCTGQPCAAGAGAVPPAAAAVLSPAGSQMPGSPLGWRKIASPAWNRFRFALRVPERGSGHREPFRKAFQERSGSCAQKCPESWKWGGMITSPDEAGTQYYPRVSACLQQT